MISKVFTNEQAKQHLSYALTCGFSFDKFISGKGLYGNRVSLMRDKSAKNLYKTELEFKTSSFHIIEGIKAVELEQTILLIRKKLEEFFTKPEDIIDFLENYKKDFVSHQDIEKLAQAWFEDVGKKLLVSKILDFGRLNNFVLNHVILKFPLSTQIAIAEFRKKQVLILLTQEIVDEEFAREQIELLPTSQEKLVALKQKLLKQKMNYKKS